MQVKVTKRSVTMSEDAQGVEFSEYSRVSTLASPGSSGEQMGAAPYPPSHK